METTFAIVVGGGPVGLTAALDLGHRNVPTILISENLETAKHPRCNSTNARSMEHFRRLGIAEEIKRNAPLAKTRPQVAFATRYCGFELGRIDLSKLRSNVTVTGGAFQSAERSLTISQLFLEPILKRNAEQMKSVDARFGWRMIDFSTSPDGVVVTAEDVRTGERNSIAARFMVAADGARSAARRHFGIGMVGDDGKLDKAFVAGNMITYFIRAPSLIEASGREPANLTWIINHELRAFVFAQDNGERWIVHYQVPEAKRCEDVDHAAVLRAVFGRDVPYDVISVGPWAGGLALVAERYQDENVFLVGDAAHLFTPLGGIGMNTGIGDALNISWKIAAMFEGWGGERLLASYGAERHPIGVRNSKLGVHCSRRKGAWKIPQNIEDVGPEADLARKAFGEFIVVDDLDEYETSGLQFGERYDASPIICRDKPSAVADTWAGYVPIDYPGARVPDFILTDPDQTFHDKLGNGFALAVFSDRVGYGKISDAAAKRGLPLSIVRCAPPEGLYQSQLALIRPDRHMAWHGSEVPADALALIDLVRGA